MVEQALSWLEAGKDDKVLDLFCGIGSFTLPLARQAREVVGVEGELAMVARAEENARRNGINNARFYKADLSGDIAGMSWAREGFELVLLDPARPGAFEVMEHVVKLSPRRVVYVSCNPVTLARDSQVLVKGATGWCASACSTCSPHRPSGVHGAVRAQVTGAAGQMKRYGQTPGCVAFARSITLSGRP